MTMRTGNEMNDYRLRMGMNMAERAWTPNGNGGYNVIHCAPGCNCTSCVRAYINHSEAFGKNAVNGFLNTTEYDPTQWMQHGPFVESLVDVNRKRHLIRW